MRTNRYRNACTNGIYHIMEYEHILQTVVLPHVDFDTITHFFGLNKPLNAAALDQECANEARLLYNWVNDADKHLSALEELEDKVRYYDDRRLEIKQRCLSVWTEFLPTRPKPSEKMWGSQVVYRFVTAFKELADTCMAEASGDNDYIYYFMDPEPPATPSVTSDDDE